MLPLLQELVLFNTNIPNHLLAALIFQLIRAKSGVARSCREFLHFIRPGINFLLVLQHDQDTAHPHSWQQLCVGGRWQRCLVYCPRGVCDRLISEQRSLLSLVLSCQSLHKCLQAAAGSSFRSKDTLFPQALDFSLDGKVNLTELTLALENELLITKNGVHQAALASFKTEIRHLM